IFRIVPGKANQLSHRRCRDLIPDDIARDTKSTRTSMDIENDRGNLTLETLQKIAKPFGLKVGFVRTQNEEEKHKNA
nr:hypothetical protein [Pseudomonadota bacterium]